MKPVIAYSGNKGPKVRSDCEVNLELKDSGGINTDLVSKVNWVDGTIIDVERKIKL